MRERNESKNETLLKVQKKRFESLDQLLDQCLPTLAARLWATCCWPQAMSDGWKIGDYNFLILSAAVEKDAQIYIQYWSEPHEVVCCEVSSGEWSPGTLRYVREKQRAFLKSRGFEVAGRARNFRKEITISSAADAETLAREVLSILYEAFGYRGQWQLDLNMHRGERADNAPTYSSITPEDFAKLAAADGLAAQVAQGSQVDPPFVLLRHGRRRIMATMEEQVSDQNLYGLIGLTASLKCGVPLMDDALIALNSSIRFIRIQRVQITCEHTWR